jgi:alpha-1,3-fucosyltransferase
MALNKKRFSKLLFLVILNTLVILLVSNGNWTEDTQSNINRRDGHQQSNNISSTDVHWRLPSKIKSILFWNSPRRSEMTIFGTGHDTFVQHGCPVSDCEIVNSPHQYPGRPLDSYDAIIFNFNDEFWLTKRPIFNRQPHQRFIFFTQEPPPSIKPMNISGYRNYFNWTMTYRMDSDIRFLYGRIRPKPSAPKTMEETEARMKESTRQLMLNKRKINRRKKKEKKLVAAMISHCKTDGQREQYIKQLRKHVKVDVFGWCNHGERHKMLHCDTDELLSSTPECYNMLDSNYKFYLSFENAICPDYVTEKFFQIMSLRDIVPVVYGGVDYAQLAPEHSYIDARQFEPEQLAAYLKKLAANETLYNEYLWWKDDYVVEAGMEQMVSRGFCDLCRKLHEANQEPKMYTSMAARWNPARCQRPKHGGTKTNNKQQKLTRNLSAVSAFSAMDLLSHRNRTNQYSED